MGCRCVIVSKDTDRTNANQMIGIYLHSHGDIDTVKYLLDEVKAKGPRNVISDSSYGWARACQIIGDVLTSEALNSQYETAHDHAYETGLGIGIVKTLDCHNYDNGVYYIDENWDIVKHTDGQELV